MGDFQGFPKATFSFLRGLSKNNKKAWFDAHKDDYESFYVEPALAFVRELGLRLRKIRKSVQFDPKVGGSVMRIYRDVRFSKDKRPYKDHLDLFFWEGAKKGWDSPGFFLRLEHDELWLGAGMHQFVDGSQLAMYRKAVADARRGKKLEALVTKLRKAGYTVGGQELKKVPKGFDPDHDRADLLKHKGLWAGIETKIPKEASSAKLVGWCAAHFEKLAPISEWLLS